MAKSPNFIFQMQFLSHFTILLKIDFNFISAGVYAFISLLQSTSIRTSIAKIVRNLDDHRAKLPFVIL